VVGSGKQIRGWEGCKRWPENLGLNEQGVGQLSVVSGQSLSFSEGNRRLMIERGTKTGHII
jgi:hypothetical protein